MASEEHVVFRRGTVRDIHHYARIQCGLHGPYEGDDGAQLIGVSTRQQQL